MRVLIIGGGTPPSKELILKEYSQSDYVICADKGGEYLFKLALTPDLLIGDFDSIALDALSFFKNSEAIIETYPREKDYTDSELCVEKAISLGAEEVIMLGFTGTRIDHLLGNIGLLEKCLKMGIEAYIVDDNNKVYLAGGAVRLKGNVGAYISLQAFTGEVRGLTLRGVKYPLENYDLKPWSSYTVSNVIMKPEVTIDFKEGILIIIESRD